MPIKWACIEGDELEVPEWFVPSTPTWNKEQWHTNVLLPLVPLMRHCTRLSGSTNQLLASLKRGARLEFEAIFLQRQTKCLLVTSFKAFFKTEEGSMFKAHYPEGGNRQSKSMNKAYIQLKPGFCPGSKQVDLHRLLCYMYNGPPPQGGHRYKASHRCEHKLCIAGWHMLWETWSQDKLRNLAKRRRDELP
jgi:hypothetical protein